MEFRTRYSTIGIKPGLTFTEPSMTQQSLAAETDINNIMQKYSLTDMAYMAAMDSNATYEDVSDIGDYQDSLAKVSAAQERFMSLPSTIRDQFDNDPVNMLSFMQDPANREECIKLGLIYDRTISDSVSSDSIVDSSAGAEK